MNLWRLKNLSYYEFLCPLEKSGKGGAYLMIFWPSTGSLVEDFSSTMHCPAQPGATTIAEEHHHKHSKRSLNQHEMRSSLQWRVFSVWHDGISYSYALRHGTCRVDREASRLFGKLSRLAGVPLPAEVLLRMLLVKHGFGWEEQQTDERRLMAWC
jgi:hypothetical protein